MNSNLLISERLEKNEGNNHLRLFIVKEDIPYQQLLCSLPGQISLTIG